MCTPLFGQDAPAATASATEARADRGTYTIGIQVPEGQNPEKLSLYPFNVLSQVREKWYPVLQKTAGRQTGTVVVEFEINKDGSLRKIHKIESGGDASHDGAALGALSASVPFPHLPAEYPGKTFKMRMRFGYQPENSATPSCVGPDSGAHPDGSMIYHVGKDVTAPHAITSPEPDYTEEARQARYMSLVTVAGTVDPQGAFTDLCILQGAEFGLEENAIRATKTWRFEPATLQGKPVPVRISVEVSFQLD